MEEESTSHVSGGEALDDSSHSSVEEKKEFNPEDGEYKIDNMWLHRLIEESSKSTPQVQESILKILKSRNFDIEVDIETKNDRGETPLMVALKQKNKLMAEHLIKKGAIVNWEDSDCMTPLMQAVILKLAKIVDLLLKNGAYSSHENKRYGTPLHVAIKNNSESIVDKLIRAGADVNFATVEYGTPLEAALTAGNLCIMDKLLANGATFKPTCVFPALLKCHHYEFPELLYLFVENGFDVNSKGPENESLLHLAVTIQSATCVDYLLRKNADVNAKNNAGETPLNLAVEYSDDCLVVKLLLENGCDIDLKYESGKAPLHFAVTKSNYPMVKLLLDHNCNVNIKDESGQTPLHYAIVCHNSSIVNLLLEYNCDVNAKDTSGNTALHLAVRSFGADKVRHLLNAGADLNITNSSGLSSWALLFTSTSTSTFYDFKQMVSYMKCARKLFLAKVSIKLSTDDGRFSIESTIPFDVFDAHCLQELDRIKAKKFGNNSIYNLLSDSKDPVCACNPEMKDYINSDNVTKDFPLYSSLLKRKFVEKNKTNSLLANISISLRTIKGLNETHIVLPSEMSRKVCLFLQDDDIENVKIAFEPN